MPITLSPSRTHLLRDGKPFFWLADTCWNGVMKATEAEWETYLSTRAAQGFNVIQFVCTHWRAYNDEQAFSLGPLTMNESFFARRDKLFEMIRDHGLAPAPVLLWAIGDAGPGYYLSEDDAFTVASYLRDHWGKSWLSIPRLAARSSSPLNAPLPLEEGLGVREAKPTGSTRAPATTSPPLPSPRPTNRAGYCSSNRFKEGR